MVILSIGTGFIVSAVTSLLLDDVNKRKSKKFNSEMKSKILYNLLIQLRDWVNEEDEVSQFERSLNEKYMADRLKESRDAKLQVLSYINQEEYKKLDIIEGQLTGIINKLLENLLYYDLYSVAFQDLLNEPVFLQPYEYENLLISKNNIDIKDANNIGNTVFLFKLTIKCIKEQLAIFAEIEAD